MMSMRMGKKSWVFLWDIREVPTLVKRRGTGWAKSSMMIMMVRARTDRVGLTFPSSCGSSSPGSEHLPNMSTKDFCCSWMFFVPTVSWNGCMVLSVMRFKRHRAF
ncbi:mCG1036587 [Mus musculus]|uniref:Uncharacterized protein n=1 Tax=Mus musculus TaxID=10090 RepID=Q9D2Y3_MOUSE|nr:mCG1036587 [Mus musculus]BAB31321.1 unnamed protein product [Mus musculus]